MRLALVDQSRLVQIVLKYLIKYKCVLCEEI